MRDIYITSEPYGRGSVVRNNNRAVLFEGVEYSKMLDGMKKWSEGMLIQQAFPFLSADQREFLMTGILPGEWEQMFGGAQ